MLIFTFRINQIVYNRLLITITNIIACVCLFICSTPTSINNKYSHLQSAENPSAEVSIPSFTLFLFVNNIFVSIL